MKFPRFNINKKSAKKAAPSPVVPQENHEAYMPHEESAVQETAEETAPVQETAPATAPSQEEKPVEETTPIVSEKISINAIFSCIWRNKWKYVLPLLITGALVSWLALSIPRYYRVTVMLAPEYTTPSTNLGGLGSIAGSLGLNIGNLNSTDAIVPMFYPDLLASTDFLVPLFNVEVTTKDGKFKGRYADYLSKYQESPWWEKEMAKLKERISPTPKSEVRGGTDSINPFALTFMEDAIMRAIKGAMTCSVDKKTDVITLTTQAQAPLVAALIADTVRQRLQDFITQYRTVKARRDLELVQSQCTKAHDEYLKKQHEYATFVDANQDLVLETFKTKEKDLEDEMQLAFNAYSTLRTRVQIAEAKVEERTPAFTTLQNASVPVKHAGPKRVFMVLGSLIMAFVVTTIVVVSRDKRVRW